jgi:hypothetical protein
MKILEIYVIKQRVQAGKSEKMFVEVAIFKLLLDEIVLA